MTKRHRSAVTGEYVTAEQAKADPERTVSESSGSEFAQRVFDVLPANRGQLRCMTAVPDALLDRIEALEAAVAELRGKP